MSQGGSANGASRAGTDVLVPSSTPEERRRARRRRRLELPWVRLGLLVAVAGFAIWGTTTPGGVSARAEDAWRWLQGKVDEVAADPELKRAETLLDGWYDRAGRYPDRASFDPDDPEYALPVGLSIEFCSARHVVLSSLTGRGTVSRLLVDGERVGDVDGNPGCPVDPDLPERWVD
jgi:hypothetical protein